MLIRNEPFFMNKFWCTNQSKFQGGGFGGQISIAYLAFGWFLFATPNRGRPTSVAGGLRGDLPELYHGASDGNRRAGWTWCVVSAEAHDVVRVSAGPFRSHGRKDDQTGQRPDFAAL